MAMLVNGLKCPSNGMVAKRILLVIAWPDFHPRSYGLDATIGRL
jgi:hypothetical protein